MYSSFQNVFLCMHFVFLLLSYLIDNALHHHMNTIPSVKHGDNSLCALYANVTQWYTCTVLWITWLWPRVWCASPDRHPTFRVSPIQGARFPSQPPAPLQQPWCGTAHIRSSHRWSGCRRCRPPWHTRACPSESESWAPDLDKDMMNCKVPMGGVTFFCCCHFSYFCGNATQFLSTQAVVVQIWPIQGKCW